MSTPQVPGAAEFAAAGKRMYDGYQALVGAGVPEEAVVQMFSVMLAPACKPLFDMHNGMVKAGFTKEQSTELIVSVVLAALK